MCSARNDILKSDVADPASLRVMQLLGRQGGVSQACGQDPPRQELRPKSQRRNEQSDAGPQDSERVMKGAA